MGDPFERVAAGINRDLAWIAGGVIAIGGAVVTGALVAVEVLMHRHRNHKGETTA